MPAVSARRDPISVGAGAKRAARRTDGDGIGADRDALGEALNDCRRRSRVAKALTTTCAGGAHTNADL